MLFIPMAANIPKPTFRKVADKANRAVVFKVVQKRSSLESSTKLSTPRYYGSDKKSHSKKDIPRPHIVGTRKKTAKPKKVGRMNK